MSYSLQIEFALIVAIPVACIAWTFTQEEVFRELRERLNAYRANPRRPGWLRKLAYLPTCPYCFSHYVAALFILLLRFRMLADDWRGYVVSLFSLVLISNVYLTLYQLLRVALRASRGLADRAEAEAMAARQGPLPTAFDRSLANGNRCTRVLMSANGHAAPFAQPDDIADGAEHRLPTSQRREVRQVDQA